MPKEISDLRLHPQVVMENFFTQLPESEKIVYENQVRLTNNALDRFLCHLQETQQETVFEERAALQQRFAGKIAAKVVDELALRANLLNYLRLPSQQRTNSPFNEIVGSLYSETGVVDEARFYQILQLSSLGIITSYNDEVEKARTQRVAAFSNRDSTRREMAKEVSSDLEQKRPFLETDENGETVGRANILNCERHFMEGDFLTRYQLAAVIKRQVATPEFLITLKTLQRGEEAALDFSGLRGVLGLTDEEVDKLQNNPTSTELSHILDQKLARVMTANLEEKLIHEEDRSLFRRLFGYFNPDGDFERGLFQEIIAYPGAYNPKTGELNLDFIADPALMVMAEDESRFENIFNLLNVSFENRGLIIQEIREDDQRRVASFKRRLARMAQSLSPGRLVEIILPVFADNMAIRAKLQPTPGPFWDEIGVFDSAVATNFILPPEGKMAIIPPIKQIVFGDRVLEKEIQEDIVNSHETAAFNSIEEGTTLFVPSFASGWINLNQGQVNATGINSYVFMAKNFGAASFLGRSSGSLVDNRGILDIGEKSSVFCQNFESSGICTLLGKNALLFLTKEPLPDRFIFRNSLPSQILVLPPLPDPEMVFVGIVTAGCQRIEKKGDIFVIASTINKKALAIFRLVETIKDGSMVRHLVFVDGLPTDEDSLAALEIRLKSKTGQKIDLAAVCQTLATPIKPSAEAISLLSAEPVDQKPPELYTVYRRLNSPLNFVSLVEFEVGKSKLIDRLRSNPDEAREVMNELTELLAFEEEGDDEKLTLFKLKLVAEFGAAFLRSPQIQDRLLQENCPLLGQMLTMIACETENPLRSLPALKNFSLLLLELAAGQDNCQRLIDFLEEDRWRSSLSRLPLVANRLIYFASNKPLPVKEEALAIERNVHNLFRLLYSARRDLFVVYDSLRNALLQMINVDELKAMEIQGKRDELLIPLSEEEEQALADA